MDADKHKIWLIAGIGIAILAVAFLIFYPMIKGPVAGQAVGAVPLPRDIGASPTGPVPTDLHPVNTAELPPGSSFTPSQLSIDSVLVSGITMPVVNLLLATEKNVGSACTGGGECASEICLNGKCDVLKAGLICVFDQQCASGICDANLHICNGNAALGGSCTNDDQCNAGYKCTKYLCFEPCVDSIDNGKNILVKGITSGRMLVNGQYVYYSNMYDHCDSGTTADDIIEYSCENNLIRQTRIACPTGKSCDSGACVADCTPVCSGRNCGDNGCGGSCGTCAAGLTCVGSTGECVDLTQAVCGDGTCAMTETVAGCPQDCSSECIPQCTGKVCGPDGCGGSCGSCLPTQTCTAAGICENNIVTTIAGDVNGDGCVNLLDIAQIGPNVNLQCVPS